MALSPKSLSVGMIGFDTSAQLSADQVKTLAALDLRFGVRYVPLSGQSPNLAIKQAEVDAFASLGLGLMLVQFPRTSGWSEAVGYGDGQAAGAYALSLGYPPGACLWLDLGNPGSSQAAIAYANNWYKGCVAAGMYGSALGVYCEPGVPLTSDQLYHNLTVARYWRTAAQCPNVTTRGYQMMQLWPGNVRAAGTVIDYDAIQSDYLGSLPVAAYGTSSQG